MRNATTASPEPRADENGPAAVIDLNRVRAAFPALDQEVNGYPLAYLDNAATTQKPARVLDALDRFHRMDNANVHRGIHELSNRATEAYDAARARVASFIGATDPAELIWTRGTTESINLLATTLGSDLSEGDEVVLSVLEHHSNLVPWQLAARRTGAVLRFIDIDEQGRLDLASLDDVIGDRTRIVSVGHVSNALGTVNDVRRVAGAAHAVGAVMVVDGAQSAPHLPVSVTELGCDFYAFSGHKMCGPMGIGALWGNRERLEALPPYHGGGDMIDRVELHESTFAPLPHRLEAGTPNVLGAVGLAAAVDYLEEIGRDRILEHERALMSYALDRLADVPDVVVHGPGSADERSGVVSFTMGDVHPHDLATILDARGVAIRAGHHCAQPLMRRMGVPATARASFYLYNTPAEVDRLVDGLDHARELFGI